MKIVNTINTIKTLDISKQNICNTKNSVSCVNKHLVALILLVSNCCFTTYAVEGINETTDLSKADVLFDVQKTSGMLIFKGKEKGIESFSLNLETSKIDQFNEFTQGNFAITKLNNELRWRHINFNNPTRQFYNITVKLNGDIELPETLESESLESFGKINTIDCALNCAFKTNGTITNRGEQAFNRLVLSAKEVHNYGTIQSYSSRMYLKYMFNSGVIKLGSVPKEACDLRDFLTSVKPSYKEGVVENYGKTIVDNGRLEIKGGISYSEYNKSAIKNLKMYGGDLKVKSGSLNVSETLSGEVKNIEVTFGGSLYAKRYEVKRTGYCITPQGGRLYTSNEETNKTNEQVKELTKEEAILDKLKYSKRVTPAIAYERYQKIKKGQALTLTDRKTLLRVQKEFNDKNGMYWEAVLAMKMNGLQGGGITAVVGTTIGSVVATAGATAVATAVTTVAGATMGGLVGGVVASAGIGIITASNGQGFSMAAGGTRNYGGNLANGNNYFAVGPTSGSVDWQIKQQIKRDEERNRVINNGFNKNTFPQVSNINNNSNSYNNDMWQKQQEEKERRRQEELNREYNKTYTRIKEELERAREKKNIFRPITEYKASNHHGRANPIEIINKAFNTKSHIAHNNININNNSNRLFNLLKEANITKEDIVTIYGNPYLTTISSWNNISTEKQNVIRGEYPEIEYLASIKNEWDTVNNIKDLDKGGVEDTTLEVLNTIMFVKTIATKTIQGIFYGSKKLTSYATNLFTNRHVVKTIVKNEAKLEKVTITLKQKSNMVTEDFKIKAKFLKKDRKNLVVTKNPQRNPNNAKKFRQDAIKNNQDVKNKDVDHKRDLQLGGKDEPGNMWMLDKNVNRGLGKQIHDQIKNCPQGTKIKKIKIEKLKK